MWGGGGRGGGVGLNDDFFLIFPPAPVFGLDATAAEAVVVQDGGEGGGGLRSAPSIGIYRHLSAFLLSSAGLKDKGRCDDDDDNCPRL